MDLPEDYKNGFKDFLGVEVDLSKRPLIPREETAYWTKIAIDEMKENDSAVECLDLFAGSGCIGLAILNNVPKSVCDFGDVEDNFLDQIRISLDNNGIDPERYRLMKTNFFSNITKKYDYILANPPYVAESRINEVGDDVKVFEPAIALYGGYDGMDLVKIFIDEADDYLKDGGKIYMEFDPQQKPKIEELMGVNRKYSFGKDQFDKYRFIIIEK